MICYLIAAAAVLAAVYFAVRSFLLKRSLRNASEELRRITRSLEENRVLKLETADRDLEEFVGEVNRTLSAIRREKNAFSRREQEFRQQIENISHDLSTPLTSILGYLKLMDTENMPADEKESLDTVRRKAEALSRLIGQFYEYSRVASEDYQPELAEMDLCRLLRETVLDSWKEIEGRRLEFSFHIPERPVVIRGNENSAERIIRNLLQNAERYAEHCLEISLKEEAGRVILTFENDVSDFTRGDVEQLFRRFYVKDPSRNSHGTGLGLAIAKTLAEKTGGSMRAELIGEKRLLFTVEWTCAHAGRREAVTRAH